MDDQTDHTGAEVSPEVAAQAAEMRRRLDRIAGRPSDRSVHDKLGELEATVRRLAQVVSTLALTVSRLADERLGDHEPTGTDAPPDTGDDD